MVTSTTYGAWLPGDERGFVNENDNEFGAECFRDNLLLKNALQGKAVFFQDEHAKVVLERWLKIAEEYHWDLYAIAILANHFHLVVAAP